MELKQDLFAFGAEYPEIKYDIFLDWFVQYGNIQHYWKYQPSYFLVHCLFIFGGLATLLHALIHRERLPYLWLGTLLHGLVVESMSYLVPDIDNFWHSQTPLMFLGRRLPIHIILLYPCFIYQASVAVSKLKLPNWAEPFAVGLCTVLIDIPYDIVSVNYLHWTWHDTDPNIEDRHYWVPWSSYYFHACFAASFTFWFHFFRRLFSGKNYEKWIATKFSKEILFTILASVLGTPGGILMFIPIYHPLHDIFKLHSEVTFFIILVIFLLIIWTADRSTKKTYSKNSRWNWILLVHLVLHYLCFLSILIFFKPEDEVAIGLKQEIGNCEEKVDVHTAFGMVLQKGKYLCATNYDEGYFNWDCLNGKVPKSGSNWYTACGVPLPNWTEIFAIIALISVSALVVFKNLHFHSFGEVFRGNKKRD